jgi:hypothetical protein
MKTHLRMKRKLAKATEGQKRKTACTEDRPGLFREMISDSMKSNWKKEVARQVPGCGEPRAVS